MAATTVRGLGCNLELLRPAVPRPQSPAVLCVHGLGIDSLASYYLSLAPPLVAADAEVAMYDLRGHGNSERPATGYRLVDFVDDLEGVIEVLGWQDRAIHLVGNSFGGTVVFRYAADHPERVLSITAVETEPPSRYWEGWIRAAVRGARETVHAPDSLEQFARDRGRVGRRQGESMRALVMDTTLTEDLPSGPYLTESELAAFPVPVLGLYGAESDLADRADPLERLLPDCVTVTFPGQGHRLLVEARREVAELVVPWITEGRRPAGVSAIPIPDTAPALGDPVP
ncbi:alpha/beta fold hydrolase [Actinoalloteichus hymeniacidonis]|uniref:Lysophospholipase n=1 Tax=Actinoalloteichus hymeniacidonis TaxID=340345 RepID=A0AAC9HS87_9PSEU|nr:alpha/beta hydrolase [Actinoalloteichus hymeniacidonis]AOS64463.1 lysophospholipase [Actinoalloteichus hymeniacidonis]MBB5907467.1 pimeloyl-ACP methyl ester carboxylesterase [Actinoalloteichus hymeniacidonis]